MGYGSKGRKPIERASKIAHAEIIKSPDVQAYLGECVTPSASDLESLGSVIEKLGDVDTPVHGEGDVTYGLWLQGTKAHRTRQ